MERSEPLVFTLPYLLSYFCRRCMAWICSRTVLRRGQHHSRGNVQGHTPDYRDPGGACMGATVIIGRAGGNRMDEVEKPLKYGDVVYGFGGCVDGGSIMPGRPIVILIGTPEEAMWQKQCSIWSSDFGNPVYHSL